MSANKMFEAKAKLFTKEQNVKPKHKPSIEYGDMEKLNKSFMEGQNNGIWRNPEKFGFRCATISLAVVEKAGGN